MHDHRLQIGVYLFEDVITMRTTSMLQNALDYTAAVQMMAHARHTVLNASE